MIYRCFFKLVLQRIPPERAHTLAAVALRIATAPPFLKAALRRLLQPRDRRLQVRALGRTFPSPLGAAAGMDKSATWFEELGALGFGFVEVGTVTAVEQEGNPWHPRVWRLVPDRAVLNSMGFPNDGAATVAGRLRERTGQTVTGVNIGKSRTAPLDRASEDLGASLDELGPLADYLVLNVSSPNTPGLRELQAVDPLRALIADVRARLDLLGVTVPLLIKIAPDLTTQEIDAIAQLALELRIDGIIAVNTTVDQDGLSSAAGLAATPERLGGLSGAPLKTRAVEVLRQLRALVGDELVLISVGGVETAHDVWERILSGATLVQGHTGFVYGGPLWPWRVNRELSRRVEAAGVRSLQDLVGSGVRAPSSAPMRADVAAEVRGGSIPGGSPVVPAIR